ncbi:hypothetical protein BOX15_Mlig018222g2 [Macrostomum lignano]|uniref:Uncharacterized protein n=1 Tax=Macrostomum lignano TaxID=282301 RepID=A0A267FYW2_9PLAT|nr:hypothetical protein BOX15_Mlig018222g2 [Macrostomum lignano]
MRLAYSHEWPVHLKMTSEEASRNNRPREALHEIYDIAIALDTVGCVLSPRTGSSSIVRLLGNGEVAKQAGETDMPSPCLYVSAGFPCHSLLVFDQTGRHVADVTLSLHSAVHIAGVPANSEALLQRYHIGRILIHDRSLYVADCEFDFIYVCDLAGDVRHVISWPDELCAPMGMCVAFDRLYVCDSGHRRVRVYDLQSYRPVPDEDSPGYFTGIHTRGVCQCSLGPQQQQRLVTGDFESGHVLLLETHQRCSVRLSGLDSIGEPFALVPGPLPDTVFVSSSSMQGDHSVKLISFAITGQGDGEGRLLTFCGGQGSGPGQFNKPRGLAFDPTSLKLYVVDARNYRIQVFSVDKV